ncbi:hypothetical protein E1H12_08970 [Geitlerinema sp. P-1104]|uniref:slr1601 family putative cell division protein n=1 Tax=Geitlerinema sp. P-1104 TaxID=2546230 RepID=UPI001476FA1F|nr:hypothetical protein [Geitlerinema sp. P-1104]NMG58650.1 hypothetical protein [Geitlerinema sp. P-1104]
MNAPDRLPRASVTPQVRASDRRRSRRRPSSSPRRRWDAVSRAMAVETGLQLAVSVTVSLGAIIALTHLFPSYRVSHQELERLEEEVETTRSQVRLLQGKFSRYFDPTQVNRLIEEETQRLDPQRVPIVWREPTSDETSR